MVDLRPVLWGVGLLLTAFAPMMALPGLADWLVGDTDWQVYLAAATFCLFTGLVFAMGNLSQRARPFSSRQVILLAVVGWLTLTLAGAVPLVFCRMHLSPVDAIFEAAAGITATGATVLHRLDGAAPGLLLWRALLQWMGGIGVLTVGTAVLPQLNVGGMQLYRFETARLDDRLAPRALRMLGGILSVYLGLTVILFLLLWVAGMDWFPAILHAMSTISCGGFSTSDTSVGHWHNPGVDWVILVGMLLGGAPFVVHWQIVRRQWRQVGRNSQLKGYLAAIVLASLAITLWLVIEQNAKPLPALRHSLFAVTSVMTGTGYATLDWSRWTGFPLAMLFLLTFIGGCAGSTAGGIKVFRVQVLFANAKLQFRRMLHPHAVLVPRFEGQTVTEAAAESVLGFLFVYILSFALLAMALALVGLGFTQSLGAAASALANLGPAISPDLGPLSNFGPLPDAAKWLLSAAMLFGRLELFLLLALFSRDFWQD
ncbi:MAG TPA: TrkH family potassium uptake protein [Magnetospirillaceae bacterium]|nr:TrkH family potassium uptake protein [Magnetospirillaceae bacterium]